MKRSMYLIVVLMLLLCGLSTAVAQEVTIRVAWWGDTNRNNLYEQILDRFEAAHPGIKTIREPSSWGDYWQKLTVQSASGAAPDFMGMHAQFANDYLRRGVVEPLDKYIAEGIIDISLMPQGAIDTGVVDGVTYMIPMGLTGQSFLINTTFLAELGLEPPDFNWTWDDFRRYGAEVRAALDAQGMRNVWFVDDNSKNLQLFRYWVRQLGKEIYTPDGGLGFSEDDLASWWAYWKDLRDNRITPDAPTSIEYGSATLENSLFVRQRVAIRAVPANQYKLYVDAMPGKAILINRNPSRPETGVGEYVEGAHFAISARTTDEKKIAAAKLLNFWVNTIESYELFGMDQGVPANTEMAEYVKTTVDDVQLRALEYVGIIAELASDAPPIVYPPAGASEVDSLFQATAEQVMYDVLTPEAAAREFIKGAQAVLARNR